MNAYAVQAEIDHDDSSLEVPMSSDSGDEVYAGEHETEVQGQGDSTDEDIQEILEIQKKAKKDFKRSFKTYMAKKKVREIKKSRQPFFPVVAIHVLRVKVEASSSQTVANPQGSKKYEKSIMTKTSKQYPKTPYPRKEKKPICMVNG